MLINFKQFSIQNRYTSDKRQSVKYPNLMPLARDTVSFKAKFARPKDLMDLPRKEIIQNCIEALKKNIQIGKGQEATVYKIEDYANQYCLRYERKSKANLDKLELDFNLDDYDKANFVVAKLGEGITLLKYIPGIPLKIMRNSDTPSGIKVKESLQELIANNFPEESFTKIIQQIEENRSKGIIFDRKGENLLVDPMIQEMTAIDFSPKFHDIEYNPISYIYHALDVDSTAHAPQVLGKLCNAYAERMKTAKPEELNLDVLDKNFYHRGFMDDPFNNFPDRELLEETRKRLFDDLIEAKQTKPQKEFEEMVDNFKTFVEENLIDYTPPKHEYY